MTAEEYSKQKAQEAGCGVEFTTHELADAFNAGMQEMRDRLMKDAIETSVCAMLDGIHIDILPKQLKGYRFGDKVKVLIIKED